jgi:cytochrome c-type biogenesis protein CcmH
MLEFGMRWPVALTVGLSLLAALVIASRSRSPEAPASAKALEATLLAPCCYGGTLDVHDSTMAQDLRAEIEARVGRGETTSSVQAEMVARYGERVLALPHPSAFAGAVEMVMLVVAIGGFGLYFMVRRWTRGGPASSPAASPSSGSCGTLVAPGARDDYDDRLDEELRDSE